MTKKHRIHFPPTDVKDLAQDEVYFFYDGENGRERIRLHDYDRLYDIPGLYEQVVYDRLKCQSPSMVVDVLRYSLSLGSRSIHELRVLDLGAGNGMVGEELDRHGVARLVGVDIIPQARDATERDRPGVYDAYHVMDFTELGEEERKELKSWRFDCLVSVAALGFGDIPVRAFVEAFNLVDDDGWVSFNVKETFLDRSDTSGFSKLVRELIFSEYLDIDCLQRYRHRFSVEGTPLYYFALSGKKTADVPEELLTSLES